MATIAENLSRIQSAKTDIKTAIEAKGVTVPSSATIDTYATYVSQISGGGAATPSNLSDWTYDSFGKITSAVIRNGVTVISGGAFYGCSSLTSIDIPDSVTSIGDLAFYDCSNITSCTIGSGVTFISQYAFNNCSSLTSVTVLATTPPTIRSNVFDNTNDCPIYVPSGSVEAYKAATNWSTYASRIQAIPNS